MNAQETPKITIITPTYNRAHTLPRVFESLKKQTFRDFKWLIMDDGSTDDTASLVEVFRENSSFEIEYYSQSNRHKFLTVLDGIKKVVSKYHMVVDSDDAYPDDSLEVLYNEAEQIKNQDDYIAVMGLSADEEGNIVGDRYPNDGFDGSILEMRYKYKVRGDKFGIFITSSYHKQIEGKDYSLYEGKGYIPQSVIFNEYDAKGIKTRFVNKVVRYYLMDTEDAESVSNTRWTGKNIFGLMEGHLSFLNSYRKKLLGYPKALLRNIIGFQYYALKNKISFSKIIISPKDGVIRLLGMLLFPFSFLYNKIK
ncbi:glycosyltransferase family A protein [Riemerella columbipharyngis]|uniref:Glycosyltransferase involved in cell wall bisynthesis n=1 Tax=Riemerella columbipharyngis TaxID=1071918 RepID=A0A1G7ECN0_9FLAO|nr:glycosyltransferase family 2 protein [Riemerella columbipharyngis]SDE61175.1 Glycosyltransferase involved in cell wall bisynthesis [Riemerella columbipharyngis]